MSSYDPKQTYKDADKVVLGQILLACKHFGATDREKLATVETAIVESGVKALTGGDRDSVGAFQQRAGWGSTADRIDPYKSALAFLAEARRIGKKFTTSGKLAYGVQRCAYAYRNRYSQANPAAKYAIKQYAIDTTPAAHKAPTVVAKVVAAVKSYPRRTAARAWMKKESAHPTADRYRQCQKTCRLALGIGPGADTAYHAFRAAPQSGTHHGVPQAGVPYYFESKSGPSGAGHVVIVEKPGKDIRSTTVWSTDIKRHGCVDLTTIGHLIDAWGEQPLGWLTNMNSTEL